MNVKHTVFTIKVNLLYTLRLTANYNAVQMCVHPWKITCPTREKYDSDDLPQIYLIPFIRASETCVLQHKISHSNWFIFIGDSMKPWRRGAR